MAFKSLLYLSIILFSGTVSATGMTPPPDTTSTIVDKAGALIMIEEGKTLYFEGRIKDALVQFRSAGNKDPLSWRAPFWVSRCHYDMNNYGYALKYANDAVLLDRNGIDKEVYEMLADSYHRLGSLDSAIMNYELSLEHLSKMRSTELMIPLRLEQCKYAKEHMSKDIKSSRERSKGMVNSGYDDYNPVLTNNGKTMYFSSRRSNTTGGGMNPYDQQFFEDIYTAQWNEEMLTWDSISNDLGRLNSNGFESLSCFGENGNLAYITLNTEAAPDEKIRTRGSDICEVKWTTQGRWSTPKIINNKSINTTYFEGAPTVTADGNTMYFVTDRKGDKSSTDIYVVEKKGKSWGNAKALPKTINTIGRETTPYITPDGRFLFFSSNGHLGFGAMDVYVVENKGGEWGEPINLGPKVNSFNDDTHFQYYPELKKAVMSGIEISGDKASRDIYELEFDLSEIIK